MSTTTDRMPDELVRGEQVPVNFTFTDATGDTVDVQGQRIVQTFKADLTDADTDPGVVQIITNIPSGTPVSTVAANWEQTHTRQLTAAKYIYDAWLETDGASPADGFAFIKPQTIYIVTPANDPES